MPNKTYITNETVERVNNRQMHEGVNNHSKETYCPNCKSFSVSARYRGESISRMISIEKVNKAFGKSLNTIADASKL